METYFINIIIFTITITISLLFRALFNLRSFTSKTPSQTLPPGPPNFPIISTIVWLSQNLSELEPILRNLHKKLGPMVTLNILSRPAIYVSDRSLTHQALVQSGALFADRPAAQTVIGKIISRDRHSISSASYGPTWRLLRRNLTSEILHPSRVKSYSHARKWVLQILLDSFMLSSKTGEPVRVVDNFQHAMFCLLVLLCFGDKLNQEQIKEIETVQRRLLVDSGGRFNILNLWPKVTSVLLWKRRKEFFKLVEDQEKVLARLIRARKNRAAGNGHALAYVDTLFDLQLPEEQKRKLTEKEIISLSSEFLNAGTDTTSTALQWIMANMVKYPHVQEKLYMEIKGVMENRETEVKEDDLQKLPYLKSVILEGLRRHPPGHFLLPHTVREDTVLGGFLVPKNAAINFMVAEMGWDPAVWEDPMAFKPERFVSKNKNGEVEFDITGSKEMKMMPFGVGRRICPGLGLAMLHLEYFVANLVWNFEWKAMDGDDVSLEEKQEFTVVMKTPLQACIYPRKT
ncbi:cytochrome P450, family 87, subfamily A, polypeptide 6 [Hibiscus trionum]|uniref:Cytochrome P450, family 87, subfamily A, polypeptide 6 n=1 Tax=Hibiscus trionum TaxID=183268 RepID=A0A9W7HUI5_HIBTR|nr:cytochrome P450, family 87, subfamily A, polypeptide 6 [Hibiscus trionum]